MLSVRRPARKDWVLEASTVPSPTCIESVRAWSLAIDRDGRREDLPGRVGRLGVAGAGLDAVDPDPPDAAVLVGEQDPDGPDAFARPDHDRQPARSTKWIRATRRPRCDGSAKASMLPSGETLRSEPPRDVRIGRPT